MSDNPAKIAPLAEDYYRTKQILQEYRYAKLRADAGNLDAHEIARGIQMPHALFIWLVEQALKNAEAATGIKTEINMPRKPYYTTIQMLIDTMEELRKETGSRERSIIQTKLDEAYMWAERARRNETQES